MRIRGAVPCLLLFASAASADLPEIKARGVLRVIAAEDEQPETFSFSAGANPGFERELIEGFARLQGRRGGNRFRG